MRSKTNVLFQHYSVLVLLFVGFPRQCVAHPILQDLIHRKSIPSPSEGDGKSAEGFIPRAVLLEKQSIPRREPQPMKHLFPGVEAAATSDPKESNLVEVVPNGNSPSLITKGDELKPSALQPWKRLPIKPDTEPDESERRQIHADDGTSPPAKSKLRKDFPLNGGRSLADVGRLNLRADWCEAHPFQEKIHHHGCKATFVENNMCYGQCNSFYIPKKFVSCSYCSPSEQQTLQVRLECPGQNPNFVVKKVTVVKDCRCTTCSRQVL